MHIEEKVNIPILHLVDEKGRKNMPVKCEKLSNETTWKIAIIKAKA